MTSYPRTKEWYEAISWKYQDIFIIDSGRRIEIQFDSCSYHRAGQAVPYAYSFMALVFGCTLLFGFFTMGTAFSFWMVVFCVAVLLWTPWFVHGRRDSVFIVEGDQLQFRDLTTGKIKTIDRKLFRKMSGEWTEDYNPDTRQKAKKIKELHIHFGAVSDLIAVDTTYQALDQFSMLINESLRQATGQYTAVVGAASDVQVLASDYRIRQNDDL